MLITCIDDTSLEDEDSVTIPNIILLPRNDDGTNCYDWGEHTTDTLTNTTEAAADAEANEEFTDNANKAFEDIGIIGTTAKNILGIIIMLITGIAIYIYTKNMMISLVAKISVMLILFYLGLISIFPFIVIMIIAIVVIVWSVTHSGSPSGGL
jgi:hypothetical protein